MFPVFFLVCECVGPSQACHIEGGSAGLIPSQLLEEKRKAFVKRDLELATTGTPLSGTQQSREAFLIMHVQHRLLAAQRQHLFLSISYNDFICCWLLLFLCYHASERWRAVIKHRLGSCNLIQPAGL